MADLITRLKVESSEYDNKIKRAAQGLLHMEQACRRVGGTLAVLEKDEKNFVSSLGSMETESKTARGSLNELTQAFTNLRSQYNRLTQEEKDGDMGTGLSKSLEQLKVRIQNARKELKDISSELGEASNSSINFSSVLQSLAGQLGINSQLMTALTSGTIATTAAVTAGIGAVVTATKAWMDYNDEMNRQQSMTTTITGLKGDDAEDLVIGVRALARTYDVDFRQAIETANTLIHQFGTSGEEALSLLQDGMQGMVAGDGGKLLSMIQHFAPAFRDAGISADKLVAIIHNSEGGLFSEQNMNAILMGIKNIRLMTDQTAKDLAALGVNGEEMSRKMNEGSMTVFDALQEVSVALENANSGSKEAGRVMQDVFGRQGAMQGMKLGRAIATLNTNLEETKGQTGELGESFVRLNEANMRLESTMKDIFGMSGWDDMANTLKADLANTLADVLEYFGEIRDALKNIGTSDSFETLSKAALRFSPALAPLLNGLSLMVEYLEKAKKAWDELNGKTAPEPPKKQEEPKPVTNGYKVTTDKNGNVVSTTKIRNGKETDDTERYKQTHPSPSVNVGNVPSNKQPTVRTTTSAKQEEILPEGSVAAMEKELSELQKAQKLATNTEEWQAYEKEIERVKERIAILMGELPKDMVAEIRVDAITDEATQKLREVDGVSIDDETITITANTQEAMQKVLELTRDIEGREVELKVKPVEVKDWSKLTDENIGGFISEKKKDVQSAEWESDEREKAMKQFADASAFKNVMERMAQEGIDTAEIDTSGLWEKIVAGADIDDSVWEELVEKINEKLAELGKDQIKIDLDTGAITKAEKSITGLAKVSGPATKAIGQIGSALSQIEDPTAKVAGTVAQAIATLALAYAQASKKTASPWEWVAFAATGLSTVLSASSAIKQATAGSYEQGGIVPGNSFTGDNLTASVNSGELILSRAQQANLAPLLEGERVNAESSKPYVTGENIYLGLNNFLRKTGRGEIVTSKS